MNYRDYVKKDVYCRFFLLFLILVIAYEMVTGQVLFFTRALAELGFVILGVRLWLDDKFEKNALGKLAIGMLILGNGALFVIKLFQYLA